MLLMTFWNAVRYNGKAMKDQQQKRMPPGERAKRLRFLANRPGIDPEKRKEGLKLAAALEFLDRRKKARAAKAAGEELDRIVKTPHR